jgi:hypothetical protein
LAEIFISYTSSDRDWAFWIAQELEAVGHVPHVHEWEVSGGGDIAAWMEERHHNADQILCVVSRTYLTKPYSSWERRAGQWATDRPNFVLPVFVEACEAPTLLAHIKRCDLYQVDEDEARARLKAFLVPAAKPSGPMLFPGSKSSSPGSNTREPAAFPGRPSSGSTNLALSNIPIAVPRHFLGRDDDLAAINTALKSQDGRAAITTLHGMRGVGKSTLAAAYAERHRNDYGATWWIRAQTEPTMRADLVALGVRLNWVAADGKEEPAVATVMERIVLEGDGILLIYDNAINVDGLKPYLPRGGRSQVLVTSNAHAWRGVASPVEIKLWPRKIGADYLIARTGRAGERAAAEALSEALGGLPLAHEQAAAYCERLELPLAEYQTRFETTPTRMLDDERDAPAEYHDRTTVAKTFALAIDEAAKLHRAAEPLIVCAALLAPEPIPLFLFAEAREKFGESLVPALCGDGLDEAVAALRSFALVDREIIADERNLTITTDCIRLHRLVRQVAAARRDSKSQEAMQRELVAILTTVYPEEVFSDARTWPKARRLDAIALALVNGIGLESEGKTAEQISYLLDRLASYRQSALAALDQAKLLFERALRIDENLYGSNDPRTVQGVNNLGLLLQYQGDLGSAQTLLERALATKEQIFGSEHAEIVSGLNNLASLSYAQGNLAKARSLQERALPICEKAFGSESHYTATILNTLAGVLKAQGEFEAARLLFERALAIREKVFGHEHLQTARTLYHLAMLSADRGNTSDARSLYQRAQLTFEKVLGVDHPETKAVKYDLTQLD